MIVNVYTIEAERLSKSFKNLRRSSSKSDESLVRNVMQNLTKALKFGARIVSAAVSANPMEASSTIPDVIKFYYSGQGSHLGNGLSILIGLQFCRYRSVYQKDIFLRTSKTNYKCDREFRKHLWRHN